MSKRSNLARYRANPILFIEEVLLDPVTRSPFVLLPAERNFLKHAFKINRDGRLLYSALVYARQKIRQNDT